MVDLIKNLSMFVGLLLALFLVFILWAMLFLFVFLEGKEWLKERRQNKRDNETIRAAEEYYRDLG